MPTAEAHVSAAFLLLDGDVVHQPGHLVQGPGQFTVRAGHGLVASNRDVQSLGEYISQEPDFSPYDYEILTNLNC